MEESESHAHNPQWSNQAGEEFKRRIHDKDAFEAKYMLNLREETVHLEPDGGQTKIQCYELVVDMQDKEKRADTITQFMLEAGQQGYKGFMGPVVFPPGERDGVFGSIFFALEKPVATQPAINPPAPKE